MIPNKRMLHTKIWDCEQLLRLNITARLLYIATISFADDAGRLRGDPSYLKRKVFHSDRIGEATIRKITEELNAEGLIVLYQTGEGTFIVHPNWHRYQTLRADRTKQSEIPPPPVDRRQPTDDQPTAQVNKKEEMIIKPSQSGENNIFQEKMKKLQRDLNAQRASMDPNH